MVLEALVVLAVVEASADQWAPNNLLELALFVSLVDQSSDLSFVKLNGIYVNRTLVSEIQ